MEEREKRMKIAMIGHKRIPSREGGIEIVVEELAVRMAKKGHCVEVYNRKGHHVAGAEYETTHLKEYKGVKIYSVCTVDKKGLAALSSSIFASIKSLGKHYDVIHFHAEGPCAMLWLPHLFGIRTIATIHGLDWQREKWGKSRFAKAYLKFGERIAVRFADEVLVLSQNVQEYFQKVYGRKTYFLPNGVNQPQKREANQIKQRWNLEKDSYLLFLGRIVPEKGILYLLEAYSQLDIKKKLVIAGGSSDTSAYMEQLKEIAGGNETILFTGFVDGELLDELYSNAYLYILPSDLEGMPISLLEAMSYGKCCLTSDIKECTEVTKETGISFQKGNVEDLKQKLQKLCDSPQEVDRYGKMAFDRVMKYYNWDNVVEQTLCLYEGK